MASDGARTGAASELRPRFPCAGADLVAARACEQAVFGRRFKNSADELASEYGPFESSTSFGAVLRPDGTAVGAVRLIRPGPRPVKTLSDAAGPPWGLGVEVIGPLAGAGTWDVASFAVDSVAAGADRRIAMLLLSVVFGSFRDNAVTGMVAILDGVARRALAGLGVQMLDLPGAMPAPYLGSPNSVPVYRPVPDLHASHADDFAHLHKQVFHGSDIEGVDTAWSAPGAFALHASA